jgi:hypothetical protein
MHDDKAPSRRHFLSELAVASGVMAVRPLGAQSPSQAWDLAWVDRLSAAHMQVFDVTSVQADPLSTVVNYLNGFEDALGRRSPDVLAIVGITGALPMIATDDVWARYALGEKMRINDPVTRAPSTRNIYRESEVGGARAATVEALQARGVIFWQCNNALNFVASTLTAPTGKPFATVRQELIAGLLPGIRLVPAHTMLLNLVQKRGCSYQQT